MSVTLRVIKNPFAAQKQDVRSLPCAPGARVGNFIPAEFKGRDVSVFSSRWGLVTKENRQRVAVKNGDDLIIAPVIRGGGEGAAAGEGLTMFGASGASLAIGLGLGVIGIGLLGYGIYSAFRGSDSSSGPSWSSGPLNSSPTYAWQGIQNTALLLMMY